MAKEENDQMTTKAHREKLKVEMIVEIVKNILKENSPLSCHPLFANSSRISINQFNNKFNKKVKK